MLKCMARLSAVEGVIDRRILANYRLDPDATAAQLPSPFRPKLVKGYAIGGLCLIRLKKIRPAFLPVPAGIGSENAAHRIAVVWDEAGVEREGVYIPRRDTSSRLNTLVGGRLFPGIHHHAEFRVNEAEGRYDIAFNSDDDGCSMHIRATKTDSFPASSVFDGIEQASRFFEAGSLGYSPTRDSARFDGLELACEQWTVSPLEVQAVRSSFFDDKDRFPEGSATFDCALLMTWIEHAWHQRGALCCAAAGNGEAAFG